MNELMLAVVESKDRKAMAGVYARYLDANDVDWGVVNAAILTRWSMSGLQYIKTLAWKIRG